MKKKFIMFFAVVLLSFALTGCELLGISDEEAEALYKALQKQKIIDTDLEYIDKMTQVNTGLFLSRRPYYIYQNDNSDLIAIYYTDNVGNDADYDYVVTIYYDVEVRSDVKYIEDYSSYETFYVYNESDKISSNEKYDFDYNNRSVYHISKKTLFFFFKYYEIELQE